MHPVDLGQRGSLAAGLSSLCLWWEGQGWLARLGTESFRGQGQLSPGLCETYVFLQRGDIRGQELIHALWTLTAA